MDFSEPTEQKKVRRARPSCGSINQKTFAAEVDIHFSGLSNVNKRPVVMHPVLVPTGNSIRARLAMSIGTLLAFVIVCAAVSQFFR